MPKKKKSSNPEMNKIIYDELNLRGIDLEYIEINVDSNMCATIKGEVTSEKTHNEILNVMNKFIDADDITDRVIVIEDLYENDTDDYLQEDQGEHSPFEEEDDDSGTDDVHRAIEDGYHIFHQMTLLF